MRPGELPYNSLIVVEYDECGEARRETDTVSKAAKR
jgi:hypothetical protein